MEKAWKLIDKLRCRRRRRRRPEFWTKVSLEQQRCVPGLTPKVEAGKSVASGSFYISLCSTSYCFPSIGRSSWAPCRGCARFG